MRHEQRVATHPRAALQWGSLQRLDAAPRDGIRRQATALCAACGR